MPPRQLVQLLRSQVIPLTAPDRETALVVAQAKMRSIDLPDGVTLSRRKIVGRRVIIKNRRMHSNQRYFTAEWPEANLQEVAAPKIACVVSGIADYFLGNSCAHCNPGTFILIPSNVPHQRYAPNLDGERLHNGSCSLVQALAYQHGVHFWYHRSVNERSINDLTDNYLIPSVTAAQLLQSLVDEAAAKKPHFAFVAAGFIAAFFAIIIREIEAGNYMHPGPKENVPAPAQLTANFSEQVQSYLEANCHKRLRMEDAAAHMYMSCSQFSRRMRQETGATFVEMLTNIRIERAQKMLRETDLTSVAIATLLSFRSFTYFHILFRSRVGCTPMEYRRKIRNPINLKK